MTRVALLAVPGCWATGPLGIRDQISVSNAYASRLGKDVELTPIVATVDGRDVRAVSGFQISAQASVADLGRVDLIVAPAVPDDVESAIEKNRPIVDWMRWQSEQGAHFAASSSALPLLAAADVLNDRTVAASPAIARALGARYTDVKFVTDRPLVEDGPLTTYGSALAQYQLGLCIIRKYMGEEVAALVASSFSFADVGAPFTVVDRGAGCVDADIDRVVRWVDEHLHDELRVEVLARRFGMSERNLRRRFGAEMGEPLAAYVQRSRLTKARDLLGSSNKDPEAVAFECGFSDTRALSRFLKTHTGRTLKQFRAADAEQLQH
jgi:transcriptional regulator GlxA family with amidase domain